MNESEILDSELEEMARPAADMKHLTRHILSNIASGQPATDFHAKKFVEKGLVKKVDKERGETVRR